MYNKFIEFIIIRLWLLKSNVKLCSSIHTNTRRERDQSLFVIDRNVRWSFNCCVDKYQKDLETFHRIFVESMPASLNAEFIDKVPNNWMDLLFVIWRGYKMHRHRQLSEQIDETSKLHYKRFEN